MYDHTLPPAGIRDLDAVPGLYQQWHAIIAGITGGAYLFTASRTTLHEVLTVATERQN
jgi:hypothetical protein